MPRRTAITSPTPSTAPPPASHTSSAVASTKRRTLRPSQSQPPGQRSPTQRQAGDVPVASAQGSKHVDLAPQKKLPTQAVPHVGMPKKTIARPPKYHETRQFLEKESVVSRNLERPSHLGQGVGECYRLSATMSRSISQAALGVRPISWGYGTSDGTLGHGNTEYAMAVMKRVATFRGDHLRKVSAGDKLSLFLTRAGCVFACGRLYLHQDGVQMWKPNAVSFVRALSDDDSETDDADAQLTTPSGDQEIKIVDIEAGHLVAYAIDEQGRIFAWGTRRYGQLGLGDEGLVETATIDKQENGSGSDHGGEPGANNQVESDANETDEDEDNVAEKPLRRHDPVELVPRLIRCAALDGVRITKVSAGNHFALAMSSCGKAFSWGWNWHGQLGLGAAVKQEGVTSPRQITATLDSVVVVDIAAGHSHALLVGVPLADHTSDRSVYARYSMVFAFGRGQHGCLGIGGQQDQSEPVEVAFFRGLQPTSVAAGHDHSLVLAAVGSFNYVYAFGGNAFGQLGIAQTALAFSDMPMVVDELSGLTIVKIGAGAYVSSALSGDGEVYTWGDGTHGKSARPNKRTTFMPWKIPSEADSIATDDSKPHQLNHRVVLEGDGFITQLSMGAHHTLALYRTDGKPDRWRKFPMGPVAPYLAIDEGCDPSTYPSIQCESASVHTARALFWIVLRCDKCALGPICRVCARRCHYGHKLIPTHLKHDVGDEFQQKAVSVHCACGSRRPPPVPPRPQKQAAIGFSTSKASGLNLTPVSGISVNAATISEDPTPVYCALASVPTTVPEDALLRC